MKMKYLSFWLPVALLCQIPVSGWADDYSTLKLQAGGKAYEWSVQNLHKITFSTNATMEVHTKNGQVQLFEGPTLEKMYFEASSTGIAQNVAGDKMVLQPGGVLVFPDASSGGVLKVFSMNGTQVFGTEVPAGRGSLTLPRMNRGIYVILYSGQTLKYVQP